MIQASFITTVKDPVPVDNSGFKVLPFLFSSAVISTKEALKFLSPLREGLKFNYSKSQFGPRLKKVKSSRLEIK